MAQKVIDVTRYKDNYDELSKTPKNYAKDNYFLKELQDKVNAEWKYRPNRVAIEYEAEKATLERATQKHYGDDNSLWKPIEVVIQSVISEKNKNISDDYRNIAFKDIHEDRFYIGSKFRFSPDYLDYSSCECIKKDGGIRDTDTTKNVWLAINANRTSMTSSLVIERCNGVLGSTYLDAQNIEHYHYEPVIQATDLSNTNLFYNDIAILPKGSILVMAQQNDFTSTYHINQRFVVGYNQVFRITAINNFYSSSTYDPMNVGLIKLTLEHDEISEYDDFENLIAYQNNDQDKNVAPVDGDNGNGQYLYLFEKPEKFPKYLTSVGTEFQPVVKDDKGHIIENIPMYVNLELENKPRGTSLDTYVGYEGLELVEEGRYSIVGENDLFKLSRKRMYIKGGLNVRCFVLPEDSPTGAELELLFSLLLNDAE